MFHEVHGYTEAVPPGDQTIAMILFAAASHLTLDVSLAAQSIIPIQEVDYGSSTLKSLLNRCVRHDAVRGVGSSEMG
jgi:hypothetical protein